MQTDSLIQSLSAELKPVRRQDPPLTYALKMLAVSLLAMTGLVYWFSLRDDFAESISSPLFWLTGAAHMLQAALGWVAVAYVTNPGRKNVSHKVLVALGCLLVVLTMFVLQVLFTSHADIVAGANPAGLHCSENTLLMALVGFLFTLYMAEKRVVVKPLSTALIIALASAGVGFMGILLTCSIDNSMHVMAYHLLVPSFVIALASLVAGKIYLKF
jgi:hypothetical protein